MVTLLSTFGVVCMDSLFFLCKTDKVVWMLYSILSASSILRFPYGQQNCSKVMTAWTFHECKSRQKNCYNTWWSSYLCSRWPYIGCRDYGITYSSVWWIYNGKLILKLLSNLIFFLLHDCTIIIGVRLATEFSWVLKIYPWALHILYLE